MLNIHNVDLWIKWHCMQNHLYIHKYVQGVFDINPSCCLYCLTRHLTVQTYLPVLFLLWKKIHYRLMFSLSSVAYNILFSNVSNFYKIFNNIIPSLSSGYSFHSYSIPFSLLPLKLRTPFLLLFVNYNQHLSLYVHTVRVLVHLLTRACIIVHSTASMWYALRQLKAQHRLWNNVFHLFMVFLKTK